MATALFDNAGARAYLTGKAINAKAAKSVTGMNDAYAIALASAMHASEIATGDTSLKLLQGERDPKEEAQLYANYKGKAYTYGGVTYQPKTPGKSSGAKATTPNASAHSYGAAADVSGGSNPAVTVTGPAIAYMTKHRSDFGLENGSADLGIDDPAHFQIPQAALNKIKVAPGVAIPAANNLNLSAWTNAPVAHASQPNSALNAITKATGPAAAPVPMPGRPAALSGSQAAAPQPATPSSNLRLPSGKSIAPGLYPSNTPGHNVSITDDGRGNAVVKKIQNPGEIPGVIDPLNESRGTIAGGIVHGVMDDIGAKVGGVMGNAYQAATTQAGNAGNSLASTAGNAFNGMMSFFGGQNAQPGASSSSLEASGHVGAPTAVSGSTGLQGAAGAAAGGVGNPTTYVRPNGDTRQPQMVGTGPSPTGNNAFAQNALAGLGPNGQSGWAANAYAPAPVRTTLPAAPAAAAPQQYTTQQVTVANPAYAAWQSRNVGGNVMETHGKVNVQAPAAVAPPPRTIVVAKQVPVAAPPPPPVVAPAPVPVVPRKPVGVAAVANQNYYQTATGDAGSSQSGSGGGASNGYLFN